MPIMFSGEPGRVALVPTGFVSAASSVSLSGWGGFNQFRSIITRVATNERGNFQFLHTLGKVIFVYTFGDRVGDILVSGMAFSGGCGGDGLGIEAVHRFYRQNRIAVRPTPLTITIGTGTTLVGYLVGLSTDVANAELRIYQFNMTLSLIPED